MAELNKQVFGERLRDYREDVMHLTQTQLGELIGCTGKYVSMLETGIAMPSLELIINICSVCNMSASYFIVIDEIKKEIQDEDEILLEMIKASNYELKNIIRSLLRLNFRQV